MSRQDRRRGPRSASARALVFGAVLLVVGGAAAVVAAASVGAPPLWQVAAGGVAVAFAYHASAKLGPGPDAHRTSLDELISVALLVVEPSLLPWAALVGAGLVVVAAPVLGVQDRIRRPSVAKVVFNTGSLLAGAMASYLVGTWLLSRGAPPGIAALPAGLAHNLLQGALIITVVAIAQGGEALQSVGRSVREDLPFGLLAVGLGAVAGVVASAFPVPVASVTVLAVALYAWSRWSLDERLTAEAQAHARSSLPTSLLADELDQHVCQAAASLVGAQLAVIRDAPPSEGDIGVHLDDDRWLVASGPRSVDRRFTTEDEALLSALVDAIAPARRRVTALTSSPRLIPASVGARSQPAAPAEPLTLDAIERHGALVEAMTVALGRPDGRCDLARVLRDLRDRVPHVVSVSPGPSVTVGGAVSYVTALIETAIHDVVLPQAGQPVVWWRHQHLDVVMAIEDADHPVHGLEVERGDNGDDPYALRLVTRAVRQLGGQVLVHRSGSRTVALHLHLPVARGDAER